MNLCRVFILRPVATTLLAAAMLLAGLLAYRTLPVGDLPDIAVPVIYVMATQPGASPQQMASSVTTPLERRLGQVAGLSEIESDSSQDNAFILLTFDESTNIDSAANDVEAALRAARADMPATLESQPEYWKANPSDNPVMILALTSDTQPVSELYDIAKTRLQPLLAQVQGVGWVEIAGSSAPAVRVEINPWPLFKYGLGFEDIRSALASANANTPKGIIENDTTRYTLATNDQARTAAQYRDLVIGYRSGHPVRLSDVASVRNGVAAAVADHQVTVLGGGAGLVIGGKRVAGCVVLYDALGRVGIGRCQGGADILEPQPVFEQGPRVDFHPHGGGGTAGNLHPSHALYLRQQRLQACLGNVIQFGYRLRVRCQCQDHDRVVGRVGLPVFRL